MTNLNPQTDSERLEMAILRTGLEKWKIAAKAEMSGGMLSKILSGDRVPSFDQCQALAAAVGLPARNVFPDRLKVLEKELERKGA